MTSKHPIRQGDSILCIEMVLEALEKARHSLVTLDGLFVTDGFDTYHQALDDGCDPSGAWDFFVECTWRIDESSVLRYLDTVIAAVAEETA